MHYKDVVLGCLVHEVYAETEETLGLYLFRNSYFGVIDGAFYTVMTNDFAEL